MRDYVYNNRLLYTYLSGCGTLLPHILLQYVINLLTCGRNGTLGASSTLMGRIFLLIALYAIPSEAVTAYEPVILGLNILRTYVTVVWILVRVTLLTVVLISHSIVTRFALLLKSCHSDWCRPGLPCETIQSFTTRRI